jgi:hypothetical protein
MDLLSLATAAIWVEFLTITVSKYVFKGSAIKEWYNQFQSVAVLSDILSVMIGILLATILFPKTNLFVSAIGVQILHDLFFGSVVLNMIPTGHNTMIDVFKKYAAESSYGIVIADSVIISSTILLMNYLNSFNKQTLTLLALIGSYSLTYILYTNP